MSAHSLDPTTFLFNLGLTSILVAMVSGYFALSFPKEIKGLWQWSLGIGLIGVSLFLFMSRTYEAPPLWSYLLPNLGALCGCLFMNLSLLAYHDKTKHHWLAISFGVSAGFIVLVDFLMNESGTNPTRISFLSLSIGILLGWSGILLFRNEQKKNHSSWFFWFTQFGDFFFDNALSISQGNEG